MFHRSLDIDQTLYNVARLAVESFSDLCLFDLIDERSDRLYVTAAAHRDPSMERLMKKAESLLYNAEFRLHPVLQVTQSGQTFFLRQLDESAIRSHAASTEHAQYMLDLGYQSKIVVPVSSNQRIFGALTFVLTRPGHYFSSEDVELAQELGRRAGVAIANAKQYQREQHVATTLQRAFLNQDFPQSDAVRFFALYRPGSSDAELGGDWYDAYRLPSGRLVLTIGDVAGKGIEAARTMVQIRQTIRIASIVSEDAGGILSLANSALMLDRAEKLATAFVAVVQPDGRYLTYASAGHVPPFLRTGRGEVVALAAPDPPLGFSAALELHTHGLELDDGSLLVTFTDGVTEIRKDAIDGEAAVRRVLTGDAISVAANPARFVERAILGETPRDDIAIMVASFGASNIVWRFDAGDPRAAYAAKEELLAAVRRLAGPQADLHATRLIFAELIGNSVRHAAGAIGMSLVLESDGVFFHMMDEGPGFDYDPKLPFDVWAESGRGLFLVSQLARDVQVRRLPGAGSHICVELPL